MRRVCLLLAVAALLVTAVPSGASTFVAMSQGELVGQADAVVKGRVVSQNSFWSESGRLIVTETQVEVESVLVGTAPSIVTVRTAGGQVGDVIVEAYGFPTFNDNERVILFLQGDEATPTSRVLGYQQGHFEIVTRLDGVTLAVPRVEDGARYLNTRGEMAREMVSMPLADFEAAILAEAARQGRAAEQ